MRVTVFMIPDGIPKEWETAEALSADFPENGHLHVVLDRERDCAKVPSLTIYTDLGRFVGAVTKARIEFPKSPVTIHYNLDADESKRLVMTGLYKATMRQLHKAVRTVEAFRKTLHRGGPKPTPDEDRLRIVRGWLEVQGNMLKEVYAQYHGVSPRTLTNWEHDLREEGKILMS